MSCRSPGSWKVASLLVVAVVAFAACGGNGDDDAAARAPEQVEGVIVDIQGDRIDAIESFTLKDGDETYEILIDPNVTYGFNLGHLHEHLASSEPVVVDLEERDDELYALSIEDA